MFKVVSTEPVMLQNTDSTVTLSRNTTVNLMGNMNFHVADSDVVRFYPAVVGIDLGTYEVRGAIAQVGSTKVGVLNQTPITWNPYNFPFSAPLPT